MSTKVETTFTTEIEFGVSGTFQPGYADTHTDPGERDSIEDLDIDGLGLIVARTNAGGPVWETKDILAGVDRKSAAYQQIVSNILAIIGEDAIEALVQEAAE